MKKLTGLIILAGMIFVLYMACHAESGLMLEYNGKSYTAEQASSPESGFPFDVQFIDDAIAFSDSPSGVKAFIRVNTINKPAMEALRKYYNDYTSSDCEIFEKYIVLQKSYIPALQDLYRNSFLYGNSGDPYSETYMKMFYKGTDNLFKNASDIFLYNIIKSNRLDYIEETHLDLIIPVYADMSVINVNFTFKAGKLDKKTVQVIYKILDSLNFNGVKALDGNMDALENKEAIIASNKGIYRASGDTGNELTDLKDGQAGFTIRYPSSYLPYMQNNLGGRLYYRSFKINPNQILSISSEKIDSFDAVSEKILLIKEYNKEYINVKEEGKSTLNGNEYSYLNYELGNRDGVVTYFKDYFIEKNNILYDICLSSRFKDISGELNKEFEDILGSFVISNTEGYNIETAASFTIYANREEGYSFIYPENWKLSDISSDINYDELSLKIPGLSAPISVYISEGELYPGISPADIPACLSGTAPVSYSSYIKKYTPPYAGKSYKLLNWYFRESNGAAYIYKLVNYIDSNGRNRLCYTTDIVRNNKIFSMFACVSEYASFEGNMADAGINSLLEFTAASFIYEETTESKLRDDLGETRNRKVVLLENIARKVLGSNAKITQALNAGKSGSYYLSVDNIGDSGYYLVKPDFKDNTLMVEEKILKREILNEELVKIFEESKNESILSFSLNENTMAFSITSRSSDSSSEMTRAYQVNVKVTPDGVFRETLYENHDIILKTKCKAFLETFLSKDASIYFSSSDEFKEIEKYRKNRSNYTTVVYTESGNLKGFCILKINPCDDSFKIVSFVPLPNLAYEISAGIAQSAENGFIIDNTFDKERFTMNFLLYSTTRKHFNISYKIRYNPETLRIEYDKYLI